MGRALRPVEVHGSSGVRRVDTQGGNGVDDVGREDVFDGKDRLSKSDPVATRRTGSPTRQASVVTENEQLRS